MAGNPELAPGALPAALDDVVSVREGLLSGAGERGSGWHSPEVICMSRAICWRSDMGVFWTPLPEPPEDEESPLGPDRDDWPGIFVIGDCKRGH